jgi:hypothetical protein
MSSFLQNAAFASHPGFIYLGADLVPALSAAHSKYFTSFNASKLAVQREIASKLAVHFSSNSILWKRGDQQQVLRPGLTFATIDARNDVLPPVDLLYSRAMTQHLCHADTLNILNRISLSGSKYVLMRTFPFASSSCNNPYACSTDLPTCPGAASSSSCASNPCGTWRAQNLEEPPYSLAPPLRLYNEFEKGFEGKQGPHLGLWKLPLWDAAEW